MLIHRGVVGCVLLITIISQAGAGELIFTSPPRENSTEAEQYYEPVAQYLTELLGKKVVYHNSRNWLAYQKEMREGKYDIVFDGPHFISWRIEHLGHEVVARLPGDMEYFVIAPASDKNINKLDDLIGRTVCGLGPPNYGTLAVMDKFRNPVRLPVIKAIQGESPEVYAAYKAGACQSALLRSIYYDKKMTDDERKRNKIIAQFRTPNQGISLSNRLDANDKRLIAQKITQDTPVGPIRNLIERYGQKGDKHFIPTSNDEYKSQYQILEGVAYGW
ncbi:MAG: PhnD/SsuA/transferrin family substrate-binding protein [Gammaproteobacteria bacterium]|nr:PhnD/SsuA/transferrin family substrate-binding protein [Gammaproteobacteria bacterium]